MNLGLIDLSNKFIDLLFNLEDFVRAGTLIRPPGLNPTTGTFSDSELTATIQLVIFNYRPLELADPLIQLDHDKILIRDSDVSTITTPGIGDHIIETTSGQRRNILASRHNDIGSFWLFSTQKVLDEDWGGLATATVTTDLGTLSTATILKDYGNLT